MNCEKCNCELNSAFVIIDDQKGICVDCLNYFKFVCISRERVKSKKEKAIDILDGLIHFLAPIAFILLIVSYFWG